MIPLLPQLLSLEEILALRPAFDESSTHGVMSFFRVLERKSFWTFVDEGLAALLSDLQPGLRDTMIHTIRGKVTIYEPLSSQLRERITLKLSKLREHDPKRNEGITDLLDFILKTS